MKGFQLILKETEEFVKQFFRQHADDRLVYHNLHHTLNVVNHVAEISLHYNISTTEYFIMMAAAWFHDTGHLLSPADGHEAVSVALMREHLANFEIDKKVPDLIEQVIFDTRMPSNPQTLAGQILCDADLYHLGTREFFINNDLVKQEIELRNNIQVKNWNRLALDFVEQHRFFTSYCNELLDEGKRQNIVLLKQLSSE